MGHSMVQQCYWRLLGIWLSGTRTGLAVAQSLCLLEVVEVHVEQRIPLVNCFCFSTV